MDERFHVGRDTAVLESVVRESLVPAASRRGQAIGELLRGRLAGLTIVLEPWFGGQFLVCQSENSIVNAAHRACAFANSRWCSTGASINSAARPVFWSVDSSIPKTLQQGYDSPHPTTDATQQPVSVPTPLRGCVLSLATPWRWVEGRRD